MKDLEIKVGRCILTEKPFVFALKGKYRTVRCDYCFAESKVLKCGNCQYVYYCNRSCQKEAWPLHKIECSCLKRIAPRIVPDAARVLARLIFKLNKGGEFEKGYYTEKAYRKFKDLMSHYHDIKNDQRRLEHVESLSLVLRQLLGDALVPNESELLSIYGRMLVNAFNILDAEMNSIGTGIYLGVSVTDHSCTPNAVATFEGTTLYIRAIKEVPCLDWSLIFISYVDLMSTPAERRSDLKQNYYFLCECSRCIDPQETIEMNAAICPNGNCNEFIDVPNVGSNCSKCGTTIPENYRNQFDEVMSFTRMHLDEMKDVAYLDVCKIMLEKQKRLFHPLNVWHLKTLDLAFESAIQVGKWEEALHFGGKLLPGFRKYNGDLNPLLGLLYMKMGKIQLFLGRQGKEAYHNLKIAENILKITHGEHHSLYKTQLIPLLMQAAAEN